MAPRRPRGAAATHRRPKLCRHPRAGSHRAARLGRSAGARVAQCHTTVAAARAYWNDGGRQSDRGGMAAAGWLAGLGRRPTLNRLKGEPRRQSAFTNHPHEGVLLMSEEIVIASAARTPVGSFNGAFATLSAHALGTVAIVEAMKRANVAPGDVSEVIMGQILAAGQGQNPARQAAVAAGIPVERTAYGINQLCGSGVRMGNGELVDTMIKDGLWDAFNGYHMGNTAENVATKWQITREQQDEFALISQNRAEAAQKAGKFKDEIVPVTVKSRKGDVVVDQDEYPKHGTTIDPLKKLRAAFDKNGTVTAGNASGINDGAAAIVLMTATEAEKRGIRALARIVSGATAGVDPAIMGTGPIPASRM